MTRPSSLDAQPAARVLQCELVALDERGRRRAALPVVFDRWVDTGQRRSLLGSDPSGSLRLTLRLRPSAGETYLGYTFKPAPSASPSQLASIIRWFEEARPGRRSGLWDEARRSWLLGPDPVPEAPPGLAKGYVDVVKALARIERRAEVLLTVPRTITAELARDIEIADRLVQGTSVTGTWTEAQLDEDPEMRDLMRDAEHGAMVQFVAEYHLRLPDQAIFLGETEQTLHHARLSSQDAGEGPVILEPGGQNTTELVLVHVPSRTHDDGSTAWVPAAMLEPYAGRWVAQSGTTILASGRERAEVLDALRARGALATVWKVPDTGVDGGGAEVLIA